MARSEVSIDRLFAAGIILGILLRAALSVAISLTARRRGYGPERERAPRPAEIGGALIGGVWALLFPVVLLLGLRMGVFTPSEIGAFAVIYAVVIGFRVPHALRQELRRGCGGKSLDIGAVMFLLALSAVFGYRTALFIETRRTTTQRADCQIAPFALAEAA